MSWLCKFGFHMWVAIYDYRFAHEWWPPVIGSYKCKKCGKEEAVLSDQFDGTDGA